MRPRTAAGETTRPSRRTVLGLGVGAVTGTVLAGCALDGRGDSGKETPAARAVKDLEPDVAVAVEAVVLVRGAEAAVAATGTRHPALAPRLADALALHRAHLDAIVRAVPDGVDTSATGSAYDVPVRPVRALARLTATEHSLHDSLIGLAMRAESGAFARLLGAMAAAVSQRIPGLAR